jgi:death-on-curing protein
MVEYLSLADYLLIAEAVLGVEAEVLALSANLHLADSALNAPAASFAGTELHTPFAKKAAVLCARVCNNHALLDGNKRVAYECLREFVARNRYDWSDPPGDEPDGDETVKVMWDVAAGVLDEDGLAAWVAARIGVHG